MRLSEQTAASLPQIRPTKNTRARKRLIVDPPGVATGCGLRVYPRSVPIGRLDVVPPTRGSSPDARLPAPDEVDGHGQRQRGADPPPGLFDST